MTRQTKPDKALVDSWVNAWIESKNENAARELTDLLLPYVRSAAGKVVGQHELDDVVQDAFMQIFRKLHTFQGNSRLESWSYRVARNQALMRIRTKSRRPQEVEMKDDGRMSSDLQAQLDARAQLREVENALDSMQNDDANTLRAYVFDQKSLAEVADSQGLTVAAVKSRIFRARRELSTLVVV